MRRFAGPFLLLLLNACSRVVLAIRLRDFGIPAFAVEGEAAVLVCDYDLEGLDLYSLKWYKNGLEFYSIVEERSLFAQKIFPSESPDTRMSHANVVYIPRNANRYTIYKRPGVNVNQQKSDGKQVTLNALSAESTGRYRCEVSTEGPSFTTASNYGDMAIVVLPQSGPTIQGGKRRYKPGERVDVNCTSRDSKPAADLHWFINRKPVTDESLLVRYPITNSTSQTGRGTLHTAVLGLRFDVGEEHFDDGGGGDMKIKCTATIDTVYTRSNEKSAQGLKRKRHSSTQDLEMLNTAHGLSSVFSSAAPTFARKSVLTAILIAALALPLQT